MARSNRNRSWQEVQTGKEDTKRLVVRVREFHDLVRELVQLACYLLLSMISLAIVLVGAVELRTWLS